MWGWSSVNSLLNTAAGCNSCFCCLFLSYSVHNTASGMLLTTILLYYYTTILLYYYTITTITTTTRASKETYTSRNKEKGQQVDLTSRQWPVTRASLLLEPKSNNRSIVQFESVWEMSPPFTLHCISAMHSQQTLLHKCYCYCFANKDTLECDSRSNKRNLKPSSLSLFLLERWQMNLDSFDGWRRDSLALSSLTDITPKKKMKTGRRSLLLYQMKWKSATTYASD